MDYAKEYPVAMKAITEWIEKGLLKRKFHIVNGLDAAPSALPLLYSGGNIGKLCVVFFFAHGELASYLTLPGSSRFPSTKK
jgi:NADPH-dependent curcumin reductase CurA